MIDTDKYEGTWKIHGMGYWKHWYEGQCEADTNLIHDAPLLLAEVKRLRKADRDMRIIRCKNNLGSPLTDEQVEMLREEVDKQTALYKEGVIE